MISLFCLILINVLCSQVSQLPSDLFGSRNVQIWVLQHSGKLVLTQFPLANINKDDDILGILADENARLELDITPEQMDIIEKENQTFLETIGQFSSIEKNNTEAQINELKRVIEARRKDLDDLFLSHQKTRLRQIQTRLSIWQMGVFQYIDANKIEGVNPLRQRKSLAIERAQPVIDKFREESILKIKSYWEDRLSVLTKSQREEFENRYASFLSNYNPPFEVVIFQAENRKFFTKSVEEIAEKKVSGLLLPRTYETGYDGSLYATTIRGQRNGLFDEISIDFRLANAVLGILGETRVQDELGFTELQVSHIDSLTRSSVELRRDEGELVAWSNKVFSEVEKILLTHQLKALEEIAEVSEVAFGGLSFAICDGRVSKHLKINENQKTRIKEIDELFVKSVSKEFRATEEQLFKCVKDVLDPEERDAFVSAVGDTPRFIGGSNEIMIMKFEEYRDGVK